MADGAHFDQRNREAAELAHSRAAAWIETTNSQTFESGNQALKAAGVVNGGAAVALLALIGNMVDKDATASISGEAIGFALLIFVAGVSASALASGGAYITNYLYVTAGTARTWDYEHPYVHHTRRSKVYEWSGAFFHVLSVLLVLFSYSSFLYGSYVSRDLVIVAWTSGQKASQGTTPSNK